MIRYCSVCLDQLERPKRLPNPVCFKCKEIRRQLNAAKLRKLRNEIKERHKARQAELDKMDRGKCYCSYVKGKLVINDKCITHKI